MVKHFVKEVKVFLEKAEAFESENRADLMTMLNPKLAECLQKMTELENVLSEMSIQKVID